MPRIDIQLVANTSQAMSAITQAFAGIQQQAASINSIGAQLRGMSDTFFKLSSAAAGLFSVGVFSGFIDESLNSRRAVAQLEEAIKAAGLASREFSEELEAHRTALERSTAIDDDVIAGVQRFIIAFGIGRDKVAEYTQGILDFAAGMDKGPVEAAQLFSKAIAGDTIQMRGFNVEIDQSLPKMEKVAQLMAAMQSKFQGQAAAKSMASGGYDALSIALKDIQKDIGGIVVDSGAIKGLADMARYIADSSNGWKEIVVYAGMFSVVSVSAVATVSALSSAFGLVAGYIVPIVAGVAAFTAGLSAVPVTMGFIVSAAAVATSAWMALSAQIELAIDAYKYWMSVRAQGSSTETTNERGWDLSVKLVEQIEKRVRAGQMENEQARLLYSKIQQAVELRGRGLMTETQYHDRMVMITEEMVKQNKLVNPEFFKQERVQSPQEKEAAAKQLANYKSGLLQLEDAQLKASYEKGLIDTKSFYDRKKEIVRSELEQEQAIKLAEIDKVAADLEKAEKNPKTNSQDQAEAVGKLRAQIIDLHSQIDTAAQRNAQKIIELDSQRFEALDKQETEYWETRSKRIAEQAAKEKAVLDYQIQSVQLKTQLNNADFSKTSWEKDELEKESLKEQIALYDEKIAKLKELQNQAINEDAYNQIGADITSLQSSRANTQGSLDIAEQAPKANSYVDQLRLNVRTLKEEWGTFQQMMASGLVGGLKSAVDQFSSSITHAILVTGNWGKAFLEVGQMILTTLVQMAVKMAVVAAISAVIPGMGFAGFMGFAEGGLIHGAPSSTDNRLAAVATGEYVARSRAVSYYGPAFFEALNTMRIPKDKLMDALNGMTMSAPSMAYRAAYADGGLVTPANAAPVVNVAPSAVQNTVAVLNSTDALREFLESTPGQKIIINAVKNNKHSLGLRT